MKVKTSELTGAALDWAVGVAMGHHNGFPENLLGIRVRGFGHERIKWRPSADWAQGGPIIEREGVATRQHPTTKRWYAMMSVDLGGDTQPKWAEFTFRNVPKTASTNRRCRFDSESQLVAAMRCFVASKLGDEVDVPEELL